MNEPRRQDHPVKVYFLPRVRAFEIPDLIRTKINLLPPNIQTIRIVEIVGVDLQADGGTHVASTSEVGNDSRAEDGEQGQDQQAHGDRAGRIEGYEIWQT